MKVTLDISVLLDVFQRREPHYAASAKVVSLITGRYGAVGAWGMINSERELLAVGKSAGGSHYGTERQERDQEKANRLVDEELRRLDWTEKELAQRPKGDKQKVETARMLRQQTTMTLKWIAQRLHMGSWTYGANLLHQDHHHNVNSED